MLPMRGAPPPRSCGGRETGGKCCPPSLFPVFLRAISDGNDSRSPDGTGRVFSGITWRTMGSTDKPGFPPPFGTHGAPSQALRCICEQDRNGQPDGGALAGAKRKSGLSPAPGWFYHLVFCCNDAALAGMAFRAPQGRRSRTGRAPFIPHGRTLWRSSRVSR